MNIFHTNSPVNNRCILNEEESFHAVKVLRLSAGSVISLTDGRGNLYTGVVTDPNPRSCSVEIIEAKEGDDKRDYKLEIAISPLKNHDRFEWFIEKAVEIGVDKITPLICSRSLKTSIKRERAEKLITAAMKQSLKTSLTKLNAAEEFSSFITRENPCNKLIAYCGSGLKKIGELVKKGDDVLILIGPEGDFSESEIESALKHGFTPVTFGNSRLRTETAGIVACHSVSFINMY